MWRSCLCLPLLVASAGAAHGTDQLTTLYQFQGGTTDGSAPAANIAMDKAGNIYGTTLGSGAYGGGTVYEVSPPAAGQTAWTEAVLWSFSAVDRMPGGLVRDKRGNLYGVTYHGGPGCGTVWELRTTASGWKYKTLWKFRGANALDGCRPLAALNFDASGALYGTTSIGGASNDGTVFKLTPAATGSEAWTESVIWAFSGTDGTYPNAQVNFDAAGNLYGTSIQGGANDDGTAWQLVPPVAGGTNWTRNLIWTFGGTTGAYPTQGPMVFDAAGNLYGTTLDGGTGGVGAAFELSPPSGGGTQWTESVIFNFVRGRGGAYPSSGGAMTGRGALVVPVKLPTAGGITELISPSAGGTSWRAVPLVQFDGQNGSTPEATPLLGRKGAIFGTTELGGANDAGTVWELSPQ